MTTLFVLLLFYPTGPVRVGEFATKAACEQVAAPLTVNGYLSRYFYSCIAVVKP